MTPNNGANPLRWDCKRQGCFNAVKRPKIEMFAGCLPGRGSFGDVDAIAELAGNLLILEWKSHPNIATGQRILHEQWTANGPATVFLIVGNAETMTVSRMARVYRGVIHDWRRTDIVGLCNQIRKWATWAQAHPARAAFLTPSSKESEDE